MLEKKDALRIEIENINYAGLDNPNKAYYELVLHTEEYDFEIKRPNTIDLVRDYAGAVSDVLIIDFNMQLGDFVKHIYPKRENLRATVTNTVTGKKMIQRYKLIITDVDNDIKNGVYDATDQDTLNKEDPTRLSVQCLNETIEQLRNKTIYGTHKEIDVGSVMGVHLKEAILNTESNTTVKVKDIQMFKPSNTRAYSHVVIPDATPILDLPSYLHEGDYGVYNGNIGTYLQADGKPNDIEEILHIFPLHRPKDDDKTEKTLKIIGTRDKLSTDIVNTYTVDPDYVTIAVELGNKLTDLESVRHLNEGVGHEGIDSDTLLRRPVEVTVEKVKSSKDWIKRKHIHKLMEDKNYKSRNVGVTNNWYVERSKTLANDGKLINLDWKLSSVDTLARGMSVELYTTDKEGIIIKYIGTLLGVHAVTDSKFDTENAVLNIFIVNEYKGKKI